MKELKAIAILKMIATNEHLTGVYRNEANQALAELKAIQARLDNLRDYCNSAYVSYPGGYKFALGYIQARKDILTKLERWSKE